MVLIEVRDELARRLGRLEGVRVYGEPPDVVTELPAAIIRPGKPLAEYNGTLAGNDVAYGFEALILTGSGVDAQAWEELAAFVAPTGPRSVKAQVEDATGAQGAVDWFRVTRASEGGRVAYGKASYWGVAFQVQGYVSG
ncbi:MAG: hypothetical protein OXI91_07780 [Chloroflexota bacterium]|nr:hypothetical protein [Chloroflexota bacterium]